MYLLQMITDYGYEGCDTDNVCVKKKFYRIYQNNIF